MKKGRSSKMAERKIPLEPSTPSRSRIKAVVRQRPVIKSDNELAKMLRMSPEVCVHVRADGQTVQLKRDAFESREFRVDHALGPTASQQELYHVASKDIVRDFLHGYNGFIMAYGQTGSGKTHSMFGAGFDTYSRRAPDTMGIVHFAATDIFNRVRERHEDDRQTRVFLSFYQIYNEKVADLLVYPKGVDPGKPLAVQTSQTLNVREDTSLGKFVIDGLSCFAVASESELFSMINVAAAHRITKSQMINENSSRSHAILQLSLETEDLENNNDEGSENTSINGDNGSRVSAQKRVVRKSVLTIVDLAGSERVRKSGSLTKGRQLKSGSYSNAEQLKEAQAINKSITALGICIQTMADASERGVKPAHIPYRDSKLTRLLSEALGGSTRTCIIATIGPCLCNYEETLSTLMFANRSTAVKKAVKRVKATPVNDVFSQQLMSWKWPKRPVQKKPEVEESVHSEEVESVGDSDPSNEVPSNYAFHDPLDFNVSVRHSTGENARAGDCSPESNRKSGNRLRDIALQLASSPEQDEDMEDVRLLDREDLYSTGIARQYSEDSLVEESDVHASARKPPRFPRSPAASQSYGLNTPWGERQLDRPRSPDFSPPGDSTQSGMSEQNASNSYGTNQDTDSSYLFEFVMPIPDPEPSLVVIRNSSPSPRSQSIRTEGDINYDALNTSELSAIKALQGVLGNSVSSHLEDDGTSSSEDRPFEQPLNWEEMEGTANSRGDIFIAADVIDPQTPDSLYGYDRQNTDDHGYEAYDIDRAEPISVDDFIQTAYELEVSRRSSAGSHQSRQPGRGSDYISSSGGSRYTDAMSTEINTPGRYHLVSDKHNSASINRKSSSRQTRDSPRGAGSDDTSDLSSRLFDPLDKSSEHIGYNVPQRSPAPHNSRPYQSSRDSPDHHSHFNHEPMNNQLSGESVVDSSHPDDSDDLLLKERIINRWENMRSHELTEEMQTEEDIIREYIDTATRGREHLLYSRHSVDSILIRRLNDEVLSKEEEIQVLKAELGAWQRHENDHERSDVGGESGSYHDNDYNGQYINEPAGSSRKSSSVAQKLFGAPI